MKTLTVKYPAANYGVFDPRGIRQMQEKSIPALDSLLAGINFKPRKECARMTQNDNEISDLFFQNVTEPEPQNDSSEENKSEDIVKTVTESDTGTSEETESVLESEIKPDIETVESTDTVPLTESNSMEDPVKNHYETTTVKKKRSLFAPIVGICILLTITITAVWYVLSHGDNSNNASVNNVSLKKSFNFNSPIDEALGMNELSEMLSSQPAKVDASITIASLDGASDISGLSANYMLMRNPDKKTASAEIALSYRKAAILSATMYADKENICLKIPSLSSSVFTVKASNLGTQIENSPLFKDSLDEGDTSEEKLFFEMLNKIKVEDLFSDLTCSASDTDLLSTIINKIANTYPDDYKRIVNGITSESVEPDASGNIGTKITISEESVELFVKDLLTLAFDDEECKSFIVDYFELIYSSAYVNDGENTTYLEDLEDSDIDAEDFDEFMSKFIMQSRISLGAAGTIFANYFNQDIIVTVHENAKGELVSLTSKNSIEIEGETYDFNFYITSQTPENPTDSISFQLDISLDGETISLKFINVCNRDSEILKHNQSLILSDSSETFVINNNRTYNTTSGEYENVIKFSKDSDTLFAFNLNSTFKKIEKGNNYNIIIDYMDLVSNDTVLFSATGEINVSKLTEDIIKPSGTEYKILEMTEEELSPIWEEFSRNLDSLDETLNSYGVEN